MKIATLDLSPELFLQFCQACKDGPPRQFKVKENALPGDAKVVGVIAAADRYPLTLRLILESGSFTDISEGERMPELPLVIFESVFDGDTDNNGYCKGGCGINFYEFPDMRHTQDECGGPECSCYEIIGGHQMGCHFYARSAN